MSRELNGTRLLAAALLTGGLLASAGQAATVLYYDFEENPAGTPVTDGQNAVTVLDVSGNGYHADERTLDGRHPQYDIDDAFATTHASLDINQGGSQYAREAIQLNQTLSNTLMGSLNGNSFTVETAFKTGVLSGNSTGGKGMIFRHDGTDSSRGLLMAEMQTDGKVRLIIQAYSGVVADYTTAAAMSDNQWHHIALQHDIAADQFRIYVDYSLVHSVNIVDVSDFGGRFEGSDGLTIGGSANDLQFGFDGLVDDFRISNAALTTEQMLAIPEPATVGLLALGTLLLGRRRSR